MRRALRGFGVDDRYVGTDPKLRTSIVFCEIFPPDNFPLLFYREPKAPDMNLTEDDLDVDAIRAARIFWTTGTGLSEEPSRAATIAALEERARAGVTVHDLDFREMFWSSREEATKQQLKALDHATVAVGNLEEVALAVGEGPPERLSQRLLGLGLELAVVKLGPEGVLVAWGGGNERVPPVPVEVVNGLGPATRLGRRCATACSKAGIH